MSVLVLDNGAITVTVDPVGGVVTDLRRAGGDNLLAAESWSTPRPPGPGDSYGNDAADFLAAYRGGWHELFPNAGAPGEVMGVPLPYHGDVGRSRWDVTSSDVHSVAMSVAARLPVVLTRSMSIEGSTLRLSEVVRSDAPVDVPVAWGHHPIFAARPGMRIDLPDGKFQVDAGWTPAYADITPGSSAQWPTADGPSGPVDLSSIPAGNVERFLVQNGVTHGWAALRDPDTRTGIALAWDTAVFRNLWLWVEVGGEDFPWFGRASYVGIEPQSGTPDGLAAAIERDDALVVRAGGELTAWLTITLFDADDRAVASVDQDGAISFAERA